MSLFFILVSFCFPPFPLFFQQNKCTIFCFCNILYINQLSFSFFPLRETPCFSTKIVSKLYEKRVFSLRVSLLLFLIFYTFFFFPYLFLPVLSKSLSFQLKYLLLPLPFLSFFFFALSRIRMLVYIIMCSSFSLSFPVSFFMFYNPFAYQRIREKFPLYSKIIRDMFCVYCKKVYFCIRLARGAKPFLSLTYWKRGLSAKVLNKKTS